MKSALLSIMLMSSMAFAQTGTPAPATAAPGAAPAGKNPVIAADRQAVDQDCKAEAATAGCGTEQVGTGLLKCIHAYKKAHQKDFTISATCHLALEKLRSDRHH